jgi:hypothetical protein
MSQAGTENYLTPLADCSSCKYRDTLLAAGSCKPGDCCVAAESGRQIDRFFRAHPAYAADYTQDGFWERRAIAARYLPPDQLRPLLTDPDNEVRRMVAERFPCVSLGLMVDDAEVGIRHIVAQRMDVDDLEMISQRSSN